ncbi:hypothetical protein SteCoe_21700 [Stentor coeruleus]|uniref:Uncharacterized protein n=1 Tax=Stentor coeruleus TaxID=5963 RepID=A0A1R2BNW0_9CILI|nr:hypothetical protein SteCoe_21700 [Stentor coeruleus]
MNNQVTRMLETVYSLKKTRTIDYKIEQRAREKVRIIKKNSPEKVVVSSRSTYLEKLSPIDSMVTMSTTREGLSKLYRSRLLPAQFLSTPADVIKKLTQKVYTYNKIKDKSTKLFNQIEIHAKPGDMEEKTEKKLSDQRKQESCHNFLEDSCKQILEENKKSRRIFKIATQLLKKRTVLAKLITSQALECNQKANYDEFHKRLNEAHSHLVKQNRIHPKEKPRRRESIFLTYD